MITNKIHAFASKIKPNPMEVDYWIDTVADPYGSVIKYYKNGEWLQLLTGGVIQGTTNYNDLKNKPKINGIVIQGNVDGADLGIEANVEIVDNLTSTNKNKALSANQGNVLSSKINNINNNITTINSTLKNKADSSTTLAGYGITNAYTKTETNSAITTAIGKIPLATQVKDGLMSAEDKYKLDGLTGAYIQIVTLANYKAMEAAGTLDENTVYHIKG